jgi:histidinol-phosphatase (PHP family)
MISCHSHSGQFCHHANGTLVQVIESAIEKGFTTYCLTEHIPRPRKIDLYPEEAQAHVMPAALMALYKEFYKTARDLQST